MNPPFPYGGILDQHQIVDREKDIARLGKTLQDGVNTILMAPRRWGKSTLVKALMYQEARNPKVKYCHIDMFEIRTEEGFYEVLSRGIIKSVYSKAEQALNGIAQWLGNIQPKMGISTQHGEGFEMSFDFRFYKPDPEKILNLAEKIAKEKNIRIVICIDEFQNIETLDNSLAFQKLLRSYWQQHQHVSYLLYGSKRHMLSQLFEKQSWPFYRFGEVFYLEKIPEIEFQNYILRQFKKHNKKIRPAQARRIIQLMLNTPYHVQQFAHIVFNICKEEVSDELIEKQAIDELFMRNDQLYRQQFEQLSGMQINMLNVLAYEDKRPHNSTEVLMEYGLKSSGNVSRAMKGLEDKEVIDRFGPEIEFIDPGFKLWIRRRAGLPL